MKKLLCLSFITCSVLAMQIQQVSSEKKSILPKRKEFKENSLSFDASKKLQIEKSSLFVPSHVGDLKLYHDDTKRFHIFHNDKFHKVKKYFTDPILRNMTREQIQAFQKVGYILVNQLDNADFSLRARVRGLGGGPLFGFLAYLASKTLLYGGAATVGAATGGPAGAAAGIAIMGSTPAVETTSTAIGLFFNSIPFLP